MSRPQVGIERLPARRMSIELRESMNCKSCRKRKIKCNRTRPSCESCSVFQCPCVYDAIPKKRGPKTDVLEALLKRVDGLEKKLQDGKRPLSPSNEDSAIEQTDDNPGTGKEKKKKSPKIDATSTPSISTSATRAEQISVSSAIKDSFEISHEVYHDPFPPAPLRPILLSDPILDIFFSRINGKPYHVLDETTTRQQHRLGQLPWSLSMAIYTISLRYEAVRFKSEAALRRTIADFTRKTRQEVDPDEPSINGIQSLLLLSLALSANGQGKKSYMTFSNCIAMSISLDLFREVPPKANISPEERVIRRRLFWTCYMLDKFMTCGSKRPSLISDHSLSLRLPSWISPDSGLCVEGEIFNVGPNINYSSDSRRKVQDATALLIDVTRILGVTNRYLAAGGVKGDSHFPWHSLSNLSKIRRELDIWAAGTQDMFASIDTFFNHPECTTLLLSKLIYHLVHCLIYRPFLPLDLVELRGTGQHQSWQIEATNLCFAHANAVAELVELGRNKPLVEWPGFVSYCICTAATVHIHGVHYKGVEGDVFSFSTDFLTREMHQLSCLQSLWALVQHQREMLQAIYNAHSELVRTLASSSLRFSPVFHLEDFFDRYTGYSFDDSHVKLIDLPLKDSHNDIIRSPRSLYSAMAAPKFPYQSHSSHRRRSSVQHQTELVPNSPALDFSLPPRPIPFPPEQSQDTSLVIPDSTSFAVDSSNVQSQFSASSFPFSPFPPPTDTMLSLFAATPPPNPLYATFPFDPQNRHQNSHGGIGSGTAELTPGAQSQGSHGTSASEAGSAEKDPFLLLLEQLAENEQNPLGGPSELDCFLTAGNGTADGDSTAMIVEQGDAGQNNMNSSRIGPSRTTTEQPGL